MRSLTKPGGIMPGDKQGSIIQWPDSQACVGCPHSIFIDLIIDSVGSVYVCPLPYHPARIGYPEGCSIRSSHGIQLNVHTVM